MHFADLNIELRNAYYATIIDFIIHELHVSLKRLPTSMKQIININI